METDGFVESIVLNDEATFRLSGKVNRHNVSIWGAANEQVIVEHVRDSPKINAFCAMSCGKIYEPFLFPERTINGNIFLDMLQQWLMPEVQEDDGNEFIL
jgi:hypothetical protein